MMERSTVQRIGDVEQMVTSFRRHLRAENKGEQTITAYTYAPLQLADFLAERGMPSEVASIRREHVEAFLEDLLGRRTAATANNRYRGLVAFFTWLTDEGEITSSPMVRMKPPAIPQQPVPVPPTADIQTILKGAAGNDFEDRRDTAIIRLFAESRKATHSAWGKPASSSSCAQGFPRSASQRTSSRSPSHIQAIRSRV
jgi:site-specific recombinase XerD